MASLPAQADGHATRPSDATIFSTSTSWNAIEEELFRRSPCRALDLPRTDAVPRAGACSREADMVRHERASAKVAFALARPDTGPAHRTGSPDRFGLPPRRAAP